MSEPRDVVQAVIPGAGPLGSVSRAECLSEEHDLVEGRLIALDRKAQEATLTQHEALERTRLWIYHDWLERETIAAFAALPPDVAEKVRSGEIVS